MSGLPASGTCNSSLFRPPFPQGLSFQFSPEMFDFMLYRMRRAIELVRVLVHANRANTQYKNLMQV